MEGICDQRITREVRQYSDFAYDSLVLYTLHDLLSSLKYIFSLKFYLQRYYKVCPLHGSNGWYSISSLLHHAVSGFVWKFQLAAVYSFHSLGLILSQKETKQKRRIEIWRHINKMMYNKVATLIKYTDHSYCVYYFPVKYVNESRNISVHLLLQCSDFNCGFQRVFSQSQHEFEPYVSEFLRDSANRVGILLSLISTAWQVSSKSNLNQAHERWTVACNALNFLSCQIQGLNHLPA